MNTPMPAEGPRNHENPGVFQGKIVHKPKDKPAPLSHGSNILPFRDAFLLSPSEQKQFSEYEAIVSKGWPEFLKVGQALMAIRAKRLYRAGHDTFDSYCKDKWQYGKSQVYRFIGAAQVMDDLSPIGDMQMPNNESQVRPLLGLRAEIVKKVWQRTLQIAGNKKVTAKMVSQAVEEVGFRLPKPPKKIKPTMGMLLELLAEAERTAGKDGATLQALKSLRTALLQWKSSQLKDDASRQPEAPQPHDALTARELEIFKLLGQGNSCKEAAAILGRSEKTVSARRTVILGKMNIKSNAQIGAYCQKYFGIL